jgi:3-dehydroquinate synthase
LSKIKYSTVFIIVDNNTNEFCLPKLLPLIETDATIEIIEFEGEINKNIDTVSKFGILTELGADRKVL